MASVVSHFLAVSTLRAMCEKRFLNCALTGAGREVAAAFGTVKDVRSRLRDISEDAVQRILYRSIPIL